MCRWKSSIVERRDTRKGGEAGLKGRTGVGKSEQDRAIDCRLPTCQREKAPGKLKCHHSGRAWRFPDSSCRRATRLSFAIRSNIHQRSSPPPRDRFIRTKHTQLNTEEETAESPFRLVNLINAINIFISWEASLIVSDGQWQLKPSVCIITCYQHHMSQEAPTHLPCHHHVSRSYNPLHKTRHIGVR